MKILGVSLGTKNGNNDTMCRVALEEAKAQGAEIEFIHLMDWNIEYCSGCVACSRGLVMGKGMICTRKDDFKAFYEKIVEADGVLFVDPIFESGATGLYHSITDRMGPGHDTGMLMMLDGKLKEAGKEGLNPRLFQQKAVSFVGIGGSDWAVRCETDHAMFALSPGWKVVNNEFFSWCKDVIMQDDKIERMKEIGRNLAEAAQYLKEHGLTFSETGLEDLKEISSAAIGAVDHAVAARQDGGMEDIRQVSKLEDRVDTLEEEMRDKHIERLSKNECNPSAGVVFLDILSNLERISDHAYNVAGYVKDEL